MKPGKSRAMLQGIQCKPAEDIPHKYKTSYTLIGMDRYLQTENNPELLQVSLTLPSPLFPFPICLVSHSSFFCSLPSFFSLDQAQANYFSPCQLSPTFPHTQMMRHRWWLKTRQSRVSASSATGGPLLLGTKPTFFYYFFILCSNYSPFFFLFPSLTHSFSLFYILSITCQGFFLFYPPIAITVLKRKLRLSSTTHLSFQHYD